MEAEGGELDTRSSSAQTSVLGTPLRRIRKRLQQKGITCARLLQSKRSERWRLTEVERPQRKIPDDSCLPLRPERIQRVRPWEQEGQNTIRREIRNGSIRKGDQVAQRRQHPKRTMVFTVFPCHSNWDQQARHWKANWVVWQLPKPKQPEVPARHTESSEAIWVVEKRGAAGPQRNRFARIGCAEARESVDQRLLNPRDSASAEKQWHTTNPNKEDDKNHKLRCKKSQFSCRMDQRTESIDR